MFRIPCAIAPVALGLVMGLVGSLRADGETAPKTRDFLFTYSATVTGLAPGTTVRVWLPVPSSSEDQEVSIVKRDLPAEDKIEKDAKYGNQILFVEAKADADGKVPLSVTYRVKRREVRFDPKAMNAEAAELFLKPDAKVPIGGKSLMLIQDKKVPNDGVEAGRLLYDVVFSHMRYSKEGTGWGQGDSEWACDSKYGNCSDFHSLFISLVRHHKIPAKFEMGFPLPEKRGQGDVAGYHCWAKFKPEGKPWIPVDISEASKNPKLKEYYFGNLTEDRVAFSVGRDLTLVPKQAGPPVNFLIYPYVEVDGKIYAGDKVQRKFTYVDVEAGKQ